MHLYIFHIGKDIFVSAFYSQNVYGVFITEAGVFNGSVDQFGVGHQEDFGNTDFANAQFLVISGKFRNFRFRQVQPVLFYEFVYIMVVSEYI